jgi:hypothetical protein
MSKLAYPFVLALMVGLSSPAFADSSCSAAAEASAKNYEHEQGIIWGKMGGSIRDFKHVQHESSFGQKCLLDVSFKISHQDEIVTTRFLVDAKQRKIYATYYGVAKKSNEDQARVLTCNYGFNYDEAGYCKSEAEYDGVVATMIK